MFDLTDFEFINPNLAGRGGSRPDYIRLRINRAGPQYPEGQFVARLTDAAMDDVRARPGDRFKIGFSKDMTQVVIVPDSGGYKLVKNKTHGSSAISARNEVGLPLGWTADVRRADVEISNGAILITLPPKQRSR